MPKTRGVTLIEVVIAILVFAVAGLGLAASSAAIARQISSNTLRARSVTIARWRAETAAATPCSSINAGQSAVPAIASAWTVSGTIARTIDQLITRTDPRGMITDRYLSAVPCL